MLLFSLPHPLNIGVASWYRTKAVRGSVGAEGTVSHYRFHSFFEIKLQHAAADPVRWMFGLVCCTDK